MMRKFLVGTMHLAANIQHPIDPKTLTGHGGSAKPAKRLTASAVLRLRQLLYQASSSG